MSSKLILSSVPMYETLRKFFVDQLTVPSCPDDIILREMRIAITASEGRPLDEDEIELFFAFLKEINDVIRVANLRTEQGPKRSVGWLDSLNSLPICPAMMPSGEVRLCRIDEIFYANDNVRLRGLFEGKVPLFQAPKKSSFFRIRDLLKSRVFDELRCLEEFVNRRLTYSNDRRLDIQWSQCYAEYIDIIKR